MISIIMELRLIVSYLFVYSMYTLTNGQPREQQRCPEKCRCLHIEGRLTTNCSNTRYVNIPGPLPQGSMIVQFDQNPVNDAKWLQEAEYFLKIDRYAKDWLELSMRSCNISSFRTELFWGLQNLIKLNLAKNKITRIPLANDQNHASPFRDMLKLRVLDLSYNKITTISRRNFDGAMKLEELDLSNNEIKTIHNEAFHQLTYLRSIDLTKNQLTLVHKMAFNGLSHLKHLHLSGNPFDCDCKLREFVAWQSEKYIVQPPKCSSPERFRHKPWNHMNLDEFACAPRLTPVGGGKKAFININHTTNLSCKVTGVPEPRMIWEFHNATQTVIIPNIKYKYELMKINASGCPFYENPIQGCTWIHTLRILSIGPSDVGVYHCKANNPADTQYLVFQMDLDRGHIVQHVTGNGKGTGHLERVTPLGDDAKSGTDSTDSVEKTQSSISDGNILLISMIIGATVLVIIALMLAVLCYRRAMSKNRQNHIQGNGGTSIPQTSAFKAKAVNGYGYHIIDNGGGATSPASIALANTSASTSLRSPTSPAVPGVNPVEKPPRTHVENFYDQQSAPICEYHRHQMEQRTRHKLDDSRTGLIHAECDDSGFSDPEYQYQQRYATLPYQRSQQQAPSGSRTPGQRVLRPAIDDPLLEKKLLLMRRNSDGIQQQINSNQSNCCIGHGQSAIVNDHRTLSPYDKGSELRETAL